MQPGTLRQGLHSKISKWFRAGPNEAPELARALIVENWWKNAMSEEDTDDYSRKQTQSTNQGLSQSLDSGPLSRDDDMVKSLKTVVQNAASALSPNRVPVSFRSLQIRTIAKAREQHAPTLNEFRLSLGLPAHRKFEDIHASPLVITKLRALYEHPGEVELYPGVVAEEPPSGFMCATAIAGTKWWAGSTVMHTVLRDAMALIERDPFYSDEGWSSSSVTNWGLHEPAPDINVSYGCVMHKLFLRAFPGHFAADSVYAHFPFVTPEGNRAILARLGADVEYSFEASSGKGANISSPSLTATPGFVNLRGCPGEFSGPFDSTNIALRHAEHCFLDKGQEALISERMEIDLAEDVIAPYFAELFCSRFSLVPSSTRSDRLLTTAELWRAMKSIHEPACNLDPVNSLKLNRNAKAAVEQIRRETIKARKGRTKRT
ncbi:linoleate diol synthase [Apiospora kogelbergensis]|uniref:Linoleate diol synthase n=1 Tax=Apiospora kogelbergensis TaxID=1337665 RepID=A0AAW0QFQ0_9PEZI